MAFWINTLKEALPGKFRDVNEFFSLTLASPTLKEANRNLCTYRIN